jgi:hypothetical protein
VLARIFIFVILSEVEESLAVSSETNKRCFHTFVPQLRDYG